MLDVDFSKLKIGKLYTYRLSATKNGHKLTLGVDYVHEKCIEVFICYSEGPYVGNTIKSKTYLSTVAAQTKYKEVFPK